MTKKSDLPFGSEFSPSQIDLPVLLQLVAKNDGDSKKMQAAIQSRFFAAHGHGSARNRRTLAMNCRLGLKAYGIVDDVAMMTPFGRDLLALRTDGPKLYERLARHILLNLKGMSLVQCITDMTCAGEKVDLTTLRAGLAARGVHYPSGGKHPSMMRLWLEKAGIFTDRWQIDRQRLRDVLGTNPADFGGLARLSPTQRAFLLALANSGTSDPQPANEVAKLAAATYGVKFPEKSLPKTVLIALEAAGYITTRKTTRGRGAKPFMVIPTAKLVADVVVPLLQQLQSQVDPKLLDLLRKPLDVIMREIASKDRHVGGLALEALAFKLMRLLDMTYIATRLKAETTGGAEVDLIFESARLVFSRWQVQCKNTAHVRLDDVAKEVGLTHLLKSNVIVIVSTGQIGPEARHYARKIMADSNLCIVMIDKRDLESIRTSPAFIVNAFRREAESAMAIKKLEL